MLAKFKIAWAVGGLSDTLNDHAKNEFEELLLSYNPLGAILDAIGFSHVDLMTLDVEGLKLAYATKNY